jgi:hypothetical protein
MIMSLKCAHRWRVQRRQVRIVMPDDRQSDMNDVLPQGAGWRVQSDHQPWPGLPAERIPEWQRSAFERDGGPGLEGEETPHAVNFRDQLSHGSLALERD